MSPLLLRLLLFRFRVIFCPLSFRLVFSVIVTWYTAVHMRQPIHAHMRAQHTHTPHSDTNTLIRCPKVDLFSSSVSAFPIYVPSLLLTLQFECEWSPAPRTIFSLGYWFLKKIFVCIFFFWSACMLGILEIFSHYVTHACALRTAHIVVYTYQKLNYHSSRWWHKIALNVRRWLAFNLHTSSAMSEMD